MLIYNSNSVPMGDAILENSYLQSLSITVKSLGNGANAYEIFDLGDDWNKMDNILISFVNFISASGVSVVTNFSSKPEFLQSIQNSPAETMHGAVPNSSRFSFIGDPAFLSFSIKVTGRYFRVKLTNGTTVQSANAYIDVKGYTLT